MSDILKIALTFCAILLLLRKKLAVGYVMLIASALLALLYRMDLQNILATIKKTITSGITIKLLLALSLIRMLELILREKDVLSAMMTTVKSFFSSRRAVIISMPMLIGMLPSLGGAYFSAPMVKDATSGLKMSQEEKAFINYWFRHPWEFILPLYPGVLLASAVSNIPLYNLIAANIAYACVLVGTGFFYSMRGIGKMSAVRSVVMAGKTGGPPKKAWLSFIPVFSVLLLVLIFRMELHISLTLIVTPLILIYRYTPAEALRITRHGFAAEVIILILGIMLFKETMEASGAVIMVSRFFLEQGIPAFPILCLLPFLTGLLTGLTVGFIGSTFPLIMSITGGASPADISMAFAAGFIGVLLSPVHLCLVLTKEYFKADLWGIYQRILPAGFIIFITAVVEYIALH